MSTAPERDGEARAHLLRPASLAVFAILVCAVVFAVAWQYGWRGGLSFYDSAGDAQAQLQGAELMLQSGQYAAALRQIAPILANSQNPRYRQARLLQWQIARTQALAIPPQSPQRRRALSHLVPILDGLLRLGGWTPAQWRSLARDAAAVGAYRLSARFWTAAAATDPGSAQEDQRQAARALVAGGDPAAGGQILLNLAAVSADPAQQRSLFLQGGAWLEGGAGAALALTRCEAILARKPLLWQDRTIVLFMARLALAAGKPDLAARWLHRELLRSSGEESSR